MDAFKLLERHLKSLPHDELVSVCIGAIRIAVMHPEDFEQFRDVAPDVEAVAAIMDLMERQASE